MKRSLITTLVIGVAVAIVVGVLHATKAIAGFEAVVAQLVSDYAGATRVVGEKWQYVFVLLTAARCCLAQPEKSSACGTVAKLSVVRLFVG